MNAGRHGIVRHAWARIGLLLLIVGGCGRDETPTPLPPPTKQPSPPVATVRDILADDAALAIAVPKLGPAFTDATAALDSLRGGEAADALLHTSTGMQGDAMEWMQAHAIDPNGPAVFLFRVPPTDDAPPGAVNAVAVLHAVNPAQFLETTKSEAEPDSLPAKTVGEWALVGNDPEFLKSASKKLEALHENHRSIQFDGDNLWHGVVRPTGIRSLLESYLLQRTEFAPAFLATPLSSFMESLPDGFADTEPIPFTLELSGEHVSCDMTWASQTHPALAAWLGDAPRTNGPLEVTRDRSGAALVVHLIPSLQSLITNALQSVTLEMNDEDATAAAETLSATLGTTACLRIDGGAAALGWTVTDDARVRELYRAMLPSVSSAQPVPYGPFTIDTVRVVDPLFVTAGNGIAAIGSGTAAVQDVIDTLEGFQAQHDGATSGLRLEVQTPLPPPVETIRRVFTPAPSEATGPSDAAEPALGIVWSVDGGTEHVRISVDLAAK